MLPTSAERAASVDCGALYEELRQEMIGVQRAATAEQLEVQVPATPAWRVRDVLAHVAGIPFDLNRLEFGGDDPKGWPDRMVSRRRSMTVDEIVAEWDEEAPTFEEGLRLLGHDTGSHFVGDLHAHLSDVRATLGLPRQDADAFVFVALDFYLDSLDQSLRTDDRGTITVLVGDERHLTGTGTPEAAVSGAPFEVLRSLSGRRSLPQMLALDWTGDVQVLAPLVSRYPLPEGDLIDS